MVLELARNLKLPIDLVTQTVAILAKRRVGKSYTMRRIVEQLHRAGQQVVLVDPKGDQWGIRSAADGKAPGLPFVILGGERGDVPLEVGAGAVVAKMLVEERVSAVLDLSLFRKREVAEFMGGPMPPRGGAEGFLEVLYRLKAQEKFRTPLMLVLDEADAIAPQNPQQGEERMLGAAEDIVRRGGQRGLGCIVVTQRSAVLNKNLLTQAEILVALRTIAPQDLKAMQAWIDVHGSREQRDTLMASLPSLPVGEAWVWSPGWPTADGIFKRVQVDPIETFDSGATPRPGEKRREPKTLADVDLEALMRQMADTIEKARADDPKALRAEIGRLNGQVKQLAGEVDRAKSAPLAGKEKRVEVPVLKDAQVSRLQALVERMEKIAAVGDLARSAATEIATAIVAFRMPTPAPTPQPAPRLPQPAVAPGRSNGERVRPAAAVSSNGAGGGLKTMHRAMLTVLAQAGPRTGPLTKKQIRVRTGYRDSGPVSSAFAELQREGYTFATTDGRVAITESGVQALGTYEPLPEGHELRDALLDGRVGKLSTMERAFLARLIAAHPSDVSKGEVREACGYSDSGPVSSAFAHLVALDYAIAVGKGRLRASEELF